MSGSPALRLFNTLSRRKETFEPLDSAHVRMYVCGPTVYDRAHLGNARPVVVFDVLSRLLRRLYPKLTYVRNITDVDDKINARAAETGRPIAAITAETTAMFHEDMAALNACEPDIEPRATAHIAEMIAMIEALISQDVAYAAEGHVLFHVPSMAEYGRLSGRTRDEQIAGARVEVAPYKRDPADFILWKPSTDDLPGWDSPWGRGRPGWHLECSAMSRVYLGETFDIHGGGQDLVFPHHENEIAQSRCAHGTSFMARYWVHNGHLMVNGEKMAKSAGNFFTVREILEIAPGEAIRMCLLSTHYHQPLNWTEDALAQARTALNRFYTALRPVAALEGPDLDPPAEFLAALCDDLNTPLAITVMHGLASDLNKAGDAAGKAALKGRLLACGRLLGILAQDPEDWFQWRPAGTDDAVDDAAIEALIGERADARRNRDFARADAIRDRLLAHGIALEDGPSGTTWRR